MASGWDTAANIIEDAAVELGLPSLAGEDPYASEDAAIIQLRVFLKGLGQDLARDHQWSHLYKTHTFSTVNGTATYELPTDYLRTVDQTHWDRTDQSPLYGPVGPVVWQHLKAVDSAASIEFTFRVYNDQIHLHPTPSSVETVAFEYVSRYWVKPTGQSSPTADKPTAQTDTLYFDRRLLIAGVKVAWRETKGQDTTADAAAFNSRLAAALGGDGVAPVLTLHARPLSIVRMLDDANIPDTGYGS